MGMDPIISLPGLATTAITGTLTLTKPGTTPRTMTFPDASIEVQSSHEIQSSGWQARNHGLYTAIASATVTDPGTPAAGHEFTTLVRNGTLTTSRGSYAVAGTLVRSIWHSGSWADYPYGPLNAANTWTAAQAFRANGSHFFGIVATTGLTNVTADGGNSGTNGGASFFVRCNGATTAAWGNFSSILGGAYDARTTIYSAASNIVFQHGGSTVGVWDTSGNLGIGLTPTAASRLQVQQSGDTNAPGFRIIRSANDSLLQIGYRSGSDTWETSATFTSTGAYKPLTWLTSDLERMRLDISGNLGLGVTPAAGNGLLQLASGTTKANGIAFGTDAGLHRPFAGFVSSEALGTANDAGYRALRSGGASLVMFSSTASAFVGTDNAFPMGFRTNGFDRAVIKITGQIRFVPLSADPSGAETGDVYYNSTTNKLRVYNGAWVDLH